MLTKIIFIFVAVLSFHSWKVESSCIEISDGKGNVSDSHVVMGNLVYSKCWRIKNPFQFPFNLEIEFLEFGIENCEYAYLNISDNRGLKSMNFCNNVRKKSLGDYFDVEVKFYVWDEKFSNSVLMKFKVNFNIALDVEGGKKAIQWLLSQRSLSWGWKDKNPEAIVALYLSSVATFNGTDIEEELMVKYAEFSVATALLQNSIPNEDLSTLINAMLVTCNNPRHIFGQDLVKRLYNQIEQSTTTNPVAYLALCNANSSWPHTANSDLTKVLTSESAYPFVRDIQAFAVMAISCRLNQMKSFKTELQNSNLTLLYENTIKKFKERQLADNSFGNVHTTALLTQALMASGQQLATDWKMYGAINFLIKALNYSEDFLAIYFSLPILNNKTLVDIYKVNCTGNLRNQANLVTEIQDYTGHKIRVKYSLYIGDKKDIIHSITLQIPQNFTGYQVMQYAATRDPTYQFKWEKRSGRMYVYDISNIPNDAVSGQFWLLYIRSTANITGGELIPGIGPDELTIKNEDHLVMWYKSVTI